MSWIRPPSISWCLRNSSAWSQLAPAIPNLPTPLVPQASCLRPGEIDVTLGFGCYLSVLQRFFLKVLYQLTWKELAQQKLPRVLPVLFCKSNKKKVYTVTLQQLIGGENGIYRSGLSVAMLEANDTGVPTDNRHLFVPPNVGDCWWKTKVTDSGCSWQVYHGEFHISYTKPPWGRMLVVHFIGSSSVQKFEGSFCLLAKWPLLWMDWLFVTSFVELIPSMALWVC